MNLAELERLSPGDCDTIKRMMGHVGSKWAPMVLVNLTASSHRFGELRRALPGISQRMLTLTLREMERDGLIARKVTPSVPPRVDYSITELGAGLARAIMMLGHWSMAHADRIEAAHRLFDERAV